MTRLRIALTVLMAAPAVASMQSPPSPGLSFTRTDYVVSGVNAAKVAVGDFNADGWPDLAVANALAPALSILLGNGDGTFQPRTDYPRFPGWQVAVGDFNADGRDDIATGNYWDFKVYVGLANSDGTFGPTRVEVPLSGYPQTGAPFAIVTADVNHDGKLDMVATCGKGGVFSDEVSVVLGNGDGTFLPQVAYPSGAQPESLAIADVDEDGHPDLVVGNASWWSQIGAISILRGNGDGTFLPRYGVEIGLGDVEPNYDAQAVASGDLNGDGHVDLVVTFGGVSPAVRVLLGDGHGSFQVSGAYGAFPGSILDSGWPRGTLSFFPYGTAAINHVAVRDLNGDGHPDVLFTNRWANLVSVLLGTGDGTFADQIDFETGLHPYDVVIADLNRDGRTDFVVSNGDGQSVSVFGNFSSDTEPPVITVPGPMDVEATGADGAVATWTPPTATDDTDGSVPVTCSASSASVFPLGVTTVTCHATDAAGNATEASFTVTVRDTTPPVVSCGSADGFWHGSDVAIACSARDSGTGLADGADATFTLSTAVAVGTETAVAATGSRGVCDLARNCATAGPLGSNKVDKKTPAVVIVTPVAGTVVLHQPIAAAYSCSDAGSGVASCVGTAANGSNIDTETPGSKTFTVTGADQVGNESVRSVEYSVVYTIGVLYDQGKAKISGSTIPIKIQVLDAAGVNVSDPSLTVIAVGLSLVSTTALGPVDDSGDANPDGNFRFDGGSYVFNLKTTGLGTGTYALFFRCGADPTMYSVQFQIK